jgi:hypothetical protein
LPVVQELATPPSIAHRNVTGDSVSVKANVAVVEAVGLVGLPVIDGTGGAVVSTVQVLVAAVPVLPAGSTAATVKVCEPAVRPLYAWPVVHAVAVPASMVHTNVTGDSVSVKVNVAVVEEVGLAGPPVIDGVGGGVLSTVMAWPAFSALGDVTA